MAILTFFLLFALISTPFAISQKAIEYYSAGELSYKSGDYNTALRNYELAISTDPAIEGYDSQLKFKMGISAYMTGDYDKARSYLVGYDNDFVNSLLDSIAQRKAQDEWKKWISQYRPSTLPTTTQIPLENEQKGTNTTFIVILVFILTFSILVFTEFRIYKLRKKVIELPARPVQENTEASQVDTTSKAEAIIKSEEISDELQLIPQDAKLIDFEQLLNSEIDVFKDIFDQISSSEESSTKAEIKEAGSLSEVYNEPLKDEREKLVEEILGESKELIENIGTEIVAELKEQKKEKENETILQIELEGIEADLVSKLNKINEDSVPKSELEASFYEELQRDFSEFDELEKITDQETTILVEKLIKLRQGTEEKEN
ncbi:tetratricopeptide repeat protein [Fervidobacterium sp.]